MIVDIIAGTRPNFVKISAILRAFSVLQQSNLGWSFRLIHTGQHYDNNMSDSFFVQLGIQDPDLNLEVGSGTVAEQISKIMIGYEKVLSNSPSILCIVVGDVTSTMACAITAKNFNIPVAHVEGGIRSGDQSMPEEINRIVTDSITDWFFTTSETANNNLKSFGIKNDQIFFVGNTMVDTLLVNIKNFIQPAFFNEMSLQKDNYIVLTLHRPNNVDGLDNFILLLEAIAHSAKGMPIIFPAHPRTAKNLESIKRLPNNIILINPQPYLEFNWLVKHAKAVITDSGGISEEATMLNIPCLTIRDNTERPETVELGTNELVGSNPEALEQNLKIIFQSQWKKATVPELWDGNAGLRIIKILQKLLAP